MLKFAQIGNYIIRKLKKKIIDRKKMLAFSRKFWKTETYNSKCADKI